MSPEALRAVIADDLRAVDAVIRHRLDSDVALVRQVAEYIIAGGGKRLRPSLVLLSAGAFGYRGTQHHQLAAVVEFIHTATLLHDDVVDASDLRRGQATANALYGNAAAVLVGDFVYSRAFQMMVETDSMRVMQVLAEATNTIAEGEVMQLMNVHDADTDETRYLEVIRRKTAKLFEAATRLGAILGGGSPAQEEAMAVYGMHLGSAFQLIDDVLDYSGAARAIGKNLGDDLAEGKPTLPLIHAMRCGTEVQRALIRSAIQTGGRDAFPEVMAVLESVGSIAYAREAARREAATASAAVATLPASPHRDALAALADRAVERDA